MCLQTETILEFLPNHAGFLQSIRFSKIWVCDGTWANVIDQIRSRHAKSSLQLKECQISYPNAENPNAELDILQTTDAPDVMRENINAFLRWHWEIPRRAPYLHDLGGLVYG